MRDVLFSVSNLVIVNCSCALENMQSIKLITMFFQIGYFLFTLPVFQVPASLIAMKAHFLISRPVLNGYYGNQYFSSY